MSMLREPATTNSPARTLDEQAGLARSGPASSAGRRRGARVRARSRSLLLRSGARFTERDAEAAGWLPAPLLAGPNAAEDPDSQGDAGPTARAVEPDDTQPIEVRPMQAIDLSDGPKLIIGPEPFRPGRFVPEPLPGEPFPATPDLVPADLVPADLLPADLLPADLLPADLDPADLEPGDLDPADLTAPDPVAPEPLALEAHTLLAIISGCAAPVISSSSPDSSSPNSSSPDSSSPDSSSPDSSSLDTSSAVFPGAGTPAIAISDSATSDSATSDCATSDCATSSAALPSTRSGGSALRAARRRLRVATGHLTRLPAEPSLLLEPSLIAALAMITTVVAGGTAAPSQAWILIAVLPVVGLIALLLPGDDVARTIRAGAILSAVACLPMLAPSLAVVTLVIALATIAVYPALVGQSAGRAVLSMAICSLATPLAVATLVHGELAPRLQLDPTAGMITWLRLALLAAIPVTAVIGTLSIAHRRTLTALAGTDPTGTDISSTDISSTDPTGTDISSTDPTGTDIRGTDTSGLNGIIRSIPRQADGATLDLTDRATIDLKTGLPDRETLLRTTDAALRDRPQVGLLLVSIDGFAELRDDLGAAIADDVTERVARRLHREFPAERLLAQVDEHRFAVLLAEVTDSTCGAAAGRVAALMNQPIVSRGHVLPLTCSTSCAVSDSGQWTAEELLRSADQGAQGDQTGAKPAGSGRSRWQLFDRAVRARVSGPDNLGTDLRDAVQGRSIEVAFQPVLALGAGDREDRIVGTEALPRWNRQDGTMVKPGVFLPLAEELGIGAALGMQVIEHALSALVIWRHEGVGVDQVWVNALPSQLEDPEFGYEVAAQLAIRGLASSCLVMEISANRLPDSEQAVATVNLLGSLGIAVALDDVGQSSIWAAPAELPISAVKLRGAPRNDGDPQTAVTRTIAQRCRALGLRVVLEGVETVGQLDTARDIGADAVQGCAIAQPMSAQDITNLLTLRLPRSFRLR